jgi:hypothetical protein
MHDFRFYLARSNGIMYNIIELIYRNQMTEDIAGFGFYDFHFCLIDDRKIATINNS